MKTLSALLLLVAVLLATSPARADDPAAPGPYAVESVEVPVASKDGRRVPVEVLIPTDAKGPLPVIFISHGWLDQKVSFRWRAEHYASRGFVAVLVEQPQRKELDVNKWAANMIAAIDAVESEAKGTSGPLGGGKIDLQKIGIEGHSYGGATAIVTASLDPRIKAVVALAPGTPFQRETFLDAAGSLTVPLQVQGAELDTVVPASLFARSAFAHALRAPSRLYVEIKGAHHLSWSDNHLLRPVRIVTDAVSRLFHRTFITDLAETIPISLRYSTAWFEEKLGIRTDRQPVLAERIPGLSDFQANVAAQGPGAKIAKARENILGSPPPVTSGLSGALRERVEGDKAPEAAER